MRQISVFLSVLMAWLCAAGTAQPQTAPESPSRLVVILYSDTSYASSRSLKGIRQSLEGSDLDLSMMELQLSSTDPAETGARIQLLHPELILTIGSPATKYARENHAQIPIVFSTVLNPATSGILGNNGKAGAGVTGATLDIPIDIQFQKFLSVYPDLRKVGVLYTQTTESLVRAAEKVVPKLGLSLISINVKSDRDLPSALDSLCHVSDGIWTIADDFIYTPQATQFFILAALRNRKPVMGFSPSFVKSGALLGLDYDYKDIGRQAGEMAVRLLKGEAISKIGIAPPGVIYLYINMKTANQLGIKIDRALVEVSKEIYR